MDKFTPKPSLFTALRGSFAALVYLFICSSVTLLLCLGLFGGSVGGSIGGSAAGGASVPEWLATSTGPGSQFAIADFDGDVRPDFATIQSDVSRAGGTNYWIQLQLSAIGPQSIRVTGPAGGLLIEARDVNGDHAVDLVLATAWHRKPVAVFLNDGHGGFSRSEPAGFPGAFRESKANWALPSSEAAGSAGLPPLPRTGIFPDATGLLRGRSPTSRFLFPSDVSLFTSSSVSYSGRAPPSAVFSA